MGQLSEKGTNSISRKLERLSEQLETQVSKPIQNALIDRSLTPETLRKISESVEDLVGALHWFACDVREGRY